MNTANGARRVVVTGLGVVTPIGTTVDELWDGVKRSACGVSELGGFPLDDLKILIAAQIKNFDPQGAPASTSQRDKIILHADRYSWFAAAAADEAVKHVRPRGPVRGPLSDGLHHRLRRGRSRHVRGFVPAAVHPEQARNPSVDAAPDHRLVGFGSCRHRVRCPRSDVCDLQRLLDGNPRDRIAAADYIRNGVVDVAIAGASEIRDQLRHDEGLAGASRAVARRLCSRSPRSATGRCSAKAPVFWCSRDYEHAKARGATIYAELCGTGMTSDARDMVNPDIEGPREAMRMALDDAGIAPTDIDYLNAHGTATAINDKNETNAIKETVRQRTPTKLAISSTKSMHGHPLGAGGGIEAVACHQGDEGELGAADNRSRRSRSRVRSRLRAQCRSRPRSQLRDVEFVRFRWSQRGAGLRTAAGLRPPAGCAPRSVRRYSNGARATCMRFGRPARTMR